MYVEDLYKDGCKKAITGNFSFVAIDDERKPTSVLPKEFLDLQTTQS